MFKFFILKKMNITLNVNQAFFNINIQNFLNIKLKSLPKIILNNSFKNFIFFQKKWIFLKIVLNILDLKKLLLIYFSIKFLFIRLYKAHGINMRIIYLKKKKRSNLLFLRLGFSHGLLIKLPKSFFFRVFKRRYFLISGFDLFFLNNLTYHLRNFRIFFQYKLIGIKLVRDNFKIKIGKKKSF